MSAPKPFGELIDIQQNMIGNWPELWQLSGEDVAGVDLPELLTAVVDEGEIIRNALANTPLDSRVRYRTVDARRGTHHTKAWMGLMLPEDVVKGGRTGVYFDVAATKWYAAPTDQLSRSKQGDLNLAERGRVLLDRHRQIGRYGRADFPGVPVARMLNAARLAQNNVALSKGIDLRVD